MYAVFILVLHMPKSFISWIRAPNVQTRAAEKQNFLYLCLYVSQRIQVSSVTLSSIWWMPDNFPFKHDKQHFPTSRADI